MVFNSIAFFVFLPLVYLIFVLSPSGSRWAVLLAASLVFYAFLGQAVLLAALATVICVSYACGIWIENSPTEDRKRVFLYAGIALDVLLLAYLKYLPFVLENLAALCGTLRLGVHVPSAGPLAFIGVSYFVFQAVSYLTDVYFGPQKAQRHFGLFSLYLAFFPKLLQGPIERAESLFPQLEAPFVFDYDATRRGMLLFAWGFYKKVVVADRLAPFVQHVYGDVHGQWGLPYILASYYYAFQLYCDFSGYTDMALGVGLLFGFKLTPNFDAPYLSTSVAEFWRRWHMSFTSCIRDYVFDPLQMTLRKWGRMSVFVSLLFAFTLVGLWHGASWGFIVWGALHGAFMVFSLLTKTWRSRLRRALRLEGTAVLRLLQIFCTFNLVCFAEIFFRCANLSDAWYMISHLFQGLANPGLLGEIPDALYSGQAPSEFWLTLAALLLVPLVYFASKRVRLLEQSAALRWTAYYALALAIFFGGQFYAPKQFIYFQF